MVACFVNIGFSGMVYTKTSVKRSITTVMQSWFTNYVGIRSGILNICRVSFERGMTRLVDWPQLIQSCSTLQLLSAYCSVRCLANIDYHHGSIKVLKVLSPLLNFVEEWNVENEKMHMDVKDDLESLEDGAEYVHEKRSTQWCRRGKHCGNREKTKISYSTSDKEVQKHDSEEVAYFNKECALSILPRGGENRWAG